VEGDGGGVRLGEKGVGEEGAECRITMVVGSGRNAKR